MMSGDLERLIGVMRQAGLSPVAEDVADLAWFADVTVARVDDEATGPADEVTPEAGVVPRDVDPTDVDPTEERADPTPEAREAREVTGGTAPSTAETTAELWHPFVKHSPSPAVPFRAPAAPALAARLGMTRALRPLKRRIAVAGDRELDAEETAYRAAQTRVVLPVFAPRLERWLDVVIVIDETATMAVSEQTIRELVAIVGDLGAFRDVRVWRTTSDSPDSRLRLRAGTSSPAAEHDPRELVDLTGRRAFVIVSDCLGSAWWDGRMAAMLETWTATAPVAIVQPLPQRLWDDCGPTVHVVTLTAIAPGAPNRDLGVEWVNAPLDFGPGEAAVAEAGAPVPVIELGERWLASWARLVAGAVGQLPGKAVFTGLMRRDGADFQPSTQHDPPAEPASAADIVNRFAQTASTDARGLAALLAAAAPLSLPVMRLVQRAMLPESAPTALREVFLGTLLEQVTEETGGALDPDDVVYDFRPGVREALLENLPRQAALRVLVEVSRYLVSRMGANVDFLALLAAEGPVGDLDEHGRAFAKVAVDVLRSLGGSYRDKAERLRRLLDQQPGAQDTDAEVVPIHDLEIPRIVIENPNKPIGRRELVSDAMGDSATGRRPDLLVRPVTESRHTPRGWKTIPLRNFNFVGRDDKLTQLRRMLVNSTQTAVLLPRALYGLGGVGKTELATEYVHRNRDDYDLVWWVAAEDPAEVRRSLVELGAELEITVPSDSSESIRRVHKALAERAPYRRWLIVFDNVGHPDTVAGLIPDPASGHVLVTTRDSEWSGHGHTMEVDKFAREESLTLLRERGGVDSGDAEAIAERLDDLPISMAQAAAWRAETKLSAAEYLRRLDEEYERRPDEDTTLGYSRHAAAAMGVAFAQLLVSAPLAAQLLRLGSFFGPEWISIEMLYRGRLATPFSRSLSRIMRDQVPLERAVKEIDRLELARYDARNKRFQIHRLVQRMVQTDIEDDALRDEIRATTQTMLAYANPGNPDLIPEYERRKHAQLSAHITASGLIYSDDDAARQVVLDQIRYRYVSGDYEGSRELAAEALAVWQTRPDPDDELTLIAQRHLANAIRQLGDPADALARDEEVLRHFRETLGADHEHSMATVNSVTADLRALGDFKRAQPMDEENWRRQVLVVGEEDLSTLRTGNNLAVDLRMVGEYVEALELDRRIQATARRVFGPENQEGLVSLSNIAADLYSLGRFAEALRTQQDTTPLLERHVGPDQLSTLRARRTTAIALRKLGRREEALDDLRALTLAYRNRFGDNHPETLLASQSLLNALRETGRVRDALDQGMALLERYERVSPEHAYRYTCAVNMAIIYRRAGRVAEARTLNEDALARLTNTFDARHPYVLCCETNLANDLAAMADFTGARRMSAGTLEESRSVRGPDHPNTLICAVNYAINLVEDGDRQEGERQLQDAIDLMRASASFGEAHPDTMLAKDRTRIDCDIEPPPT
jgi:tetratricopeptide (TPR) repeat protein